MSTSNPPEPTGVVVAVSCTATYFVDLRDEYAFTFRVPATGTRFTLYANPSGRFNVGRDYRLTITDSDATPVPLGVEEMEFLRTCLANTARRWREAITDAGTAGERTQSAVADEPGSINIEPTPAGNRAAGALLREQLARVEHLHALLGGYVATGGDGPLSPEPTTA